MLLQFSLRACAPRSRLDEILEKPSVSQILASLVSMEVAERAPHFAGISVRKEGRKRTVKDGGILGSFLPLSSAFTLKIVASPSRATEGREDNSS